jgi:uncharacterized protein YodC (DUF2158 family)
MKYQVGDLVRLKSGGPTMTIRQILSDAVGCAWFDANHKFHSEYFPLDALEKAE